MIRNKSEYNPLESILRLLPCVDQPITQATYDLIRAELFKGGIACEDEQEVNTCLALLDNLKIIDIVSEQGKTFIKRGSNGQITQ